MHAIISVGKSLLEKQIGKKFQERLILETLDEAKIFSLLESKDNIHNDDNLTVPKIISDTIVNMYQFYKDDEESIRVHLGSELHLLLFSHFTSQINEITLLLTNETASILVGLLIKGFLELLKIDGKTAIARTNILTLDFIKKDDPEAFAIGIDSLYDQLEKYFPKGPKYIAIPIGGFKTETTAFYLWAANRSYPCYYMFETWKVAHRIKLLNTIADDDAKNSLKSEGPVESFITLGTQLYTKVKKIAIPGEISSLKNDMKEFGLSKISAGIFEDIKNWIENPNEVSLPDTFNDYLLIISTIIENSLSKHYHLLGPEIRLIDYFNKQGKIFLVFPDIPLSMKIAKLIVEIFKYRGITVELLEVDGFKEMNVEESHINVGLPKLMLTLYSKMKLGSNLAAVGGFKHFIAVAFYMAKIRGSKCFYLNEDLAWNSPVEIFGDHHFSVDTTELVNLINELDQIDQLWASKLETLLLSSEETTIDGFQPILNNSFFQFEKVGNTDKYRVRPSEIGFILRDAFRKNLTSSKFNEGFKAARIVEQGIEFRGAHEKELNKLYGPRLHSIFKDLPFVNELYAGVQDKICPNGISIKHEISNLGKLVTIECYEESTFVTVALSSNIKYVVQTRYRLKSKTVNRLSLKKNIQIFDKLLQIIKIHPKTFDFI